MGVLLDGQWKVEGFEARTDPGGQFQRAPSRFRDRVSRSPGARFEPASGRYHLYVSKACPWAHRTLIVRALKGLENAVSVSILDPVMGEDGWQFSEAEVRVPDTVNGAKYLREIYVIADPSATGPVTVPVLWDKLTRTIVNNESSEIIRMFNTVFRDFASPTEAGLEDYDLYPEALREPIDAANEKIYERVNNGVYLCGFARSQSAYERAFDALFLALDELERDLAEHPFVAGEVFSEADIRLFTTLFRFDSVYYSHFKCNRKRLTDYPGLWAYTRMIYQIPGVSDTCDLAHIKKHYFMSHPHLNPSRIVPRGPELDFDEPHGRPVPHGRHLPPPRTRWTVPPPHIGFGV